MCNGTETGAIPTLVTLKFAVGYRCNLSCPFCLQQDSDRAPVLDPRLVEKIFQEPMVRDNVRLIVLTGGEPLYDVHREVSLRTVGHVHGLGKESCIFTNGTLLDERAMAEFRQAGLTRFRVSLYDPIDWGWVRDLMQRLESFGFPAMAKYTVTKESYPYLDQLLAEVPTAGVKWLQVKPYNRVEIPAVDARFEMEPQQVLDMSRTLLEFRQQFPGIKTDLLPLCYEFLINDSLEVEDLSPCNCGKGPRGYLVVGPTGEIRICGAYPNPIGNAHTDSVTEIWETHPLLWEVRNLANRPKPPECAGCAHWKKCTVTDCHSATFAKYRNFEHGNPQCPILAGIK